MSNAQKTSVKIPVVRNATLVIPRALPPRWLKIDLAPLYERLEHATSEQVPALVEAWLPPVLDLCGRSLPLTGYVVMDIKLAAARMLSQCGIDPTDVLSRPLCTDNLHSFLKNNSAVAFYAIRLFTLCLEHRENRTTFNAAIHNACTYMERHLDQKELTLRTTAMHVNLSNNHFCTMFRRQMGMSFVDYLTRLRMEKAMEYLRTTELSSADIAERVGYTDPSYFRQLFKRHVGTSPRAYRALNR